ncbi:hypothetical protein P171DRAFT_473245 [Karstenula rhodostoma CBS 690.94]|uniref:Uncharacterized protein n=1 Tax=Karstenula rhodostoma CBS 690.94 TaxID=1392251 RepID=A0A9P4UCE0_9PLEO|nr:hypothetical protein P171DRAFT_473245 [Karstenula rhodostoma CBS 690.94]
MAPTSRSKFFSWGSKSGPKSGRHQPTQETYYRTGGLLQIDTNTVHEDQFVQCVDLGDAKDTTWRRNLKNLSIVPPNYITGHSPDSALQDNVLVKSAPNLLAVFSDTTFPATSGLSPTTCIKSKYSLPPSPALPAELPGSILLDNQGYSAPATPPPEPDAESVHSSAVTSVRSMFSLSSGNAKTGPSKVSQHRKSANDLQKQSKARPSLIASPSSTDSRITTLSTLSSDNASSANSTKTRTGPDTIVEGKQWHTAEEVNIKPTASKQPTARTKQLDELKATITTQDQTISTLQSQFSRLRASHEAHINSLVNVHAAEVSALKDYTKSLESQQKGLHHASSNHLLFMLDTTDNPRSPKRDGPFSSAGSTPAGSIRSSKPSNENPRSPLRSRNNAELESLKKKLSMAKKPETGNGDAVRELNLYKQNNEALQKQVESLMKKLNHSEEEGRKQKRTLEETQKACDEWQEKASKAEELKKSTMALQNTIDHLEYRLELANVDRVDAEEQLLNVRSHRTPFDPKSPKVQVPDNRQSTRTSMSTVFANDSPISQSDQEPTTLSGFISHIERLQEQVRVKDMQIAELDADNKQLRVRYNRLRNEHRDLDLQSDVQDQLLKKAKQNEIHIEELRTAIIKREAMIGEKSKVLQQTERQLSHHKLLLEAEIRRHANLTLLADAEGNPLPELTSLASKEDIDRWVERLQKQLNKDKSERNGRKAGNESTTEALRRENDFYIREIIYYKLDCRGYKADIKKLKKIAAQMGGHDSRPGDVESPEPSVSKSAETPAPTQLLSVGSILGASTSPSPVSTGPISLTIPLTQRMTPPPSELTPAPSPTDKIKRTIKRVPLPLDINMPLTPRTPTMKADNLANEADNMNPGISPRSVARLSPERRKPTPPSPDQEKFGELATSFPLSTPAAPTIHARRSMSDSMIQFSLSSSQSSFSSKGEVGVIPIGTRERSGSAPEPPKGKSIPERPPRPRFGLFDTNSNDVAPLRLQTPRTNVLAEAMRNSPDQTKPIRQPVTRQSSAWSGFATIQASINESKSDPSSPIIDSAVPAPLQFRSREGSTSSSAIASPPSRRPSTASNSNIPFVITMGSPHNPALMTPHPPVPLTTCSITAKRNVVSPTLRTGVGGTMASTTPVTSPISRTNASKQPYFSSVLPSSSPDYMYTKSTSAPPTRSISLSSRFAAPTAASRSRTMTSGHARNLSASSLRHAINLPARIDFMKGRGKSRKDSIGHPTPLASPFDCGARDTE